MPDRDGGRERERRVERTQRTGCKRFSGHVATAKLLTSDWPLEETGLTAPPTLHCPISSRSIARPSIIDSHSPPSPLVISCIIRVSNGTSGLFLGEKSYGSERLPHPDSSYEIRNSSVISYSCNLAILLAIC